MSVNRIPSKCYGSCDFTWDEALNPVVSSFTPNTGPAETEITISGSNFDAQKSRNIVKIGDVACVVTSAKADGTELKCKSGKDSFLFHAASIKKGFAIDIVCLYLLTIPAPGFSICLYLGPGPRGKHEVFITVLGKGQADTNAFHYTYTSAVDAISPTEGPLGGVSKQQLYFLINCSIL